MSKHPESTESTASIAVQSYLADENACETLGAKLGEAILEQRQDAPHEARGSETIVIYFHGELGAGKTTMIRGLLRRFGYKNAVKSPTYTLVEPYVLGDLHIYHLDLYRLADPEELELLGLRDFLIENPLILAEWPERGRGFLPPATLAVRLEYAKRGRNCTLQSVSQTGNGLISRIKQISGISG